MNEVFIVAGESKVHSSYNSTGPFSSVFRLKLFVCHWCSNDVFSLFSLNEI